MYVQKILIILNEYKNLQPDLQCLEITEKDLKKLSSAKASQPFKINTSGVAFKQILIVWLIIQIIIIFINRNYDHLLSKSLFSLFIACFCVIIFPVILFEMQPLEASKKLIEEAKKINSIIKAINVNDQLVEAGHKGMSQNERDKAIGAIKLAREDLVRALKTERILRDNKDIVTGNVELFANNLANLKALQVDEQASEFASILSKALQVAVDV